MKPLPFRTLALAVLVPGILLHAGSAFAACTDYGDYLHREGSVATSGYALGAAISHGLAYVATHYPGGLDVVDLTDPANPRVVANVPLLDAEAVATSGNYALAAGAGLAVIDVSNPSTPNLIGGVTFPARAHRVAIGGPHSDPGGMGTFAFVAADTAGMFAVDISDPPNPQIIGRVRLGDAALGVAVRGSYAYVAANMAGLQVIDVSDPANPRVVGHLGANGWDLDVAVQGGYLYRAAAQSMDVIDITDPANPRQVGSLSQVYPQAIAVQGSYVYVANEYWGLSVIRVTSPDHPVQVGTVDNFGGRSIGIAVSPGLACIANNWAGLEVMDIRNPEDPAGLQFYACLASGLAINGRMACLVGWGSLSDTNGIRMIDVLDPRNPVLVGYTHFDGQSRDVELSGQYAFVADSDVGLESWDISVWSSPELIGNAPLPSDCYQLALSGNYAFIADYGSDLIVVDISDPRWPVIRSALSTPGLAFGVMIAGNRAYIAADSRLDVVDIADPLNPLLLGSVTTPGSAHKTAIAGSYAYVADGDAGLTVVDVSDPASPLVVANLPTAGYADAVTVSDGVAYLGAGGLQVIDVADPLAPRLLSTVHIETPRDVLVRDSNVYLADGMRDFAFLPSYCPEQHTAGADGGQPAGAALRVLRNPTRDSAVLRLDLPAAGQASVAIHDVAGRRIRLLYAGWMNSLQRDLIWDGRDDDGHAVPSGVYVARIAAKGEPRTARIVVIR